MLRKGLLNSFISSMTSFFSSCTEVAVGVLILAIGGTMVIKGSPTLSVGKLIAFQVKELNFLAATSIALTTLW